jgi:hypothetical protein
MTHAHHDLNPDDLVPEIHGLAERCGLRPLAVVPEQTGALLLVGERDGATLTLRIEGVGKRTTRSTLSVDAPGISVDLEVRPELAGELFDKVLGMTVDVEVGDDAFDRRFVVEAAPRETARQLLAAPVRNALMSLAHDHECPFVTVREGSASITWNALPDDDTLRAALDVVSELRGRVAELREGMRGLTHGVVFREVGGDAQTVDPGERIADRTRIRGARTRAVVVIGSAALAAVGFIASVVLGQAV